VKAINLRTYEASEADASEDEGVPETPSIAAARRKASRRVVRDDSSGSGEVRLPPPPSPHSLTHTHRHHHPLTHIYHHSPAHPPTHCTPRFPTNLEITSACITRTPTLKYPHTHVFVRLPPCASPSTVRPKPRPWRCEEATTTSPRDGRFI
jgi:hypothetical protein